MICCVYTADKNKKNKIWKEGFASTKGNKMTVYSDDRKFLCSFCYGPDQREYETSRYLVYIEEREEASCAVPAEQRHAAEDVEKREGPGGRGRSAEEILAILDEIEGPQLRRESGGCFSGGQSTHT